MANRRLSADVVAMGQRDPDWIWCVLGSDPPGRVTESNDVAKGAIPVENDMTMAEWVTRLSLLAKTNREAYRVLREQMWKFVQRNSARSDFPSNMS